MMSCPSSAGAAWAWSTRRSTIAACIGWSRIKMVLAGKHVGAVGLAGFRAEAEAVAKLSHPNIVQIYETGEYEGRPFFSLEFVDGGSLDRITESPTSPPGPPSSSKPWRHHASGARPGDHSPRLEAGQHPSGQGGQRLDGRRSRA